MRSLPRHTVALALAGALLAGGAACAKTDGPALGPSTGAGSTAAPGAARDIAVTLTEWTLAPAATSTSAGKVTFTAKNEGKETHELVLFKTDLPADKLPLDEEGAVDERAKGLELVDEVEDVGPGATKSFTADVTAGKYVLVCNVVDRGMKHYDQKMYAAFTVT